MTGTKTSIELRPATPYDLPFIREHVEKFMLDDEDLDFRQFIVAAEGNEIVGFGRIRPHRTMYELGGVGVVEQKRGLGIGRMIVEHLISIFPRDVVYLTTDIPEYFRRLGFREDPAPPAELLEKIRRVCERKCRQEAVVMRYDR